MSNHILERRTPTAAEPAAVLSWPEQAIAEGAELDAAAKASPKTFYGNRVLGTGAGLARVKVLRRTLKSLLQTIEALDRVL